MKLTEPQKRYLIAVCEGRDPRDNLEGRSQHGGSWRTRHALEHRGLINREGEATEAGHKLKAGLAAADLAADRAAVTPSPSKAKPAAGSIVDELSPEEVARARQLIAYGRASADVLDASPNEAPELFSLVAEDLRWSAGWLEERLDRQYGKKRPK